MPKLHNLGHHPNWQPPVVFSSEVHNEVIVRSILRANQFSPQLLVGLWSHRGIQECRVKVNEGIHLPQLVPHLCPKRQFDLASGFPDCASETLVKAVQLHDVSHGRIFEELVLSSVGIAQTPEDVPVTAESVVADRLDLVPEVARISQTAFGEQPNLLINGQPGFVVLSQSPHLSNKRGPALTCIAGGPVMVLPP